MFGTLGWIVRWCFASVSAALALEIFGTVDLSFVSDPENVLRRWIRIFVGGLEVAIVWILLDDTRHWAAEHMAGLPDGAKMSAGARKQVRRVLIRQILVAVVLVATFVPVTRWLSEGALWLFRDHGAIAPEGSVLGWWGLAVALGIAGLNLAVGFFGGFARIRSSIRAYGWKLPGAMFRMAQIRAAGPQRDFFHFVPGISSLPTLALTAFLWVDAPHAAAGWVALLALAAMMVTNTITAVLPPVWVFFSSSVYYQFEVFRILRVKWAPRNGITLLDRFGSEHDAVYASERQIMERSGGLPAALLRDPTVPRIWSVRSRQKTWENVVFYLVRMCPLIVVDARGGDSVAVVRELRSILWFGRLQRTVILTDRRGDASGFHEILREEGEAAFASQAFTESDVVGACWEGDRLILPEASILVKA